MSALKSALTLRWERRETDEKEMVASEQRVDGESYIKPWTCERHGREKKNQINPAIPPWTSWNHDSAADDTESGSCEKSSSELNVDVWRLRLWAGDADRFSVSGTASWLRGKLGWYPITAPSRKQSTIALSSGEAELIAALSGGWQWNWLLKFGCNAEET